MPQHQPIRFVIDKLANNTYYAAIKIANIWYYVTRDSRLNQHSFRFPIVKDAQKNMAIFNSRRNIIRAIRRYCKINAITKYYIEEIENLPF